jgi:hypothetical protein
MIRCFHFFAFVIVLTSANSLFAQAQRLPVSEIIEKHDANGDGELSPDELKNSRFERVFSRWDENGDGNVTSEEIISFRAKLGIDADGNRTPRTDRPSTVSEMPPIPEIEDIARVSGNSRPTKGASRKNNVFAMQTQPHPVEGTRYVVLTDQTDEAYLASLKRLADHHEGTLIQVDDLATIGIGEQMDPVRKQLLSVDAKWVAIAPKEESFRENMLLGMWKLLSALDDDTQIDVFPGIVYASTPESLATFVDQAISHEPQAVSTIKPVAISQIPSSSELRSIQKAAMLKKWFATMKVETPIVGIYADRAANAPRLEGDKIWNLKVAKGSKAIEEFPANLQPTIDDSNLIVMHGHGTPGMSCSVDNVALPSDLNGKVIFSGSCFSCSPSQSDLPAMRELPGGYEFVQREAFIIRAIDNGAKMAFGHQRLSSGFPHMFPVLEEVMQGNSAGEAYQQLLNGLMDSSGISGERLMIELPTTKKRVPQNKLLYVLICDPAMHALAR